MEASILDLRYRMRDVVKALEKREKVRILYHGKLKGEIHPAGSANPGKTADHPLFGSLNNEISRPTEVVAAMRRSRLNAL